MSKMSTSMKSKKTIVSGCSWTDRNYSSWWHPELDTSWKKWDEHVGEHYGWDIINVGTSGAGNDVIIDRALDMIYNIGNTDVDRCILALSQWQRFSLPNNKFINPNLLKWKDKKRPIRSTEELMKLHPFNDHFHACMVNNILFMLYRFIDICIIKNIEVIIVQMISSTENFKAFTSDSMYYNLNNRMLTNPYFTKIEVEANNNKNVKLLGWPFSTDLGGLNIKYLLDKRMPKDRWKVSNQDGHPSAEGNKEIANIFTEWYNDLD